MINRLRLLCWKYDCFVFALEDNTGYSSSKGYQIFCLDKDLLTLCMKKINYEYDLKWFSNMISSNVSRGYYYYIEI